MKFMYKITIDKISPSRRNGCGMKIVPSHVKSQSHVMFK